MRLPVPQITIVVLVLHMGLGCCWHHAHLAAAPCCQAEGIAPATVACAPCGHHAHDHDDLFHQHATHDDPTPNQPQRHHGSCPEGPCVFARLSQSCQPDLDTANQAAVAADINACLATVQNFPATSIDAGPRRWRYDTGPPLRAHLVLQVLQI